MNCVDRNKPIFTKNYQRFYVEVVPATYYLSIFGKLIMLSPQSFVMLTIYHMTILESRFMTSQKFKKMELILHLKS